MTGILYDSIDLNQIPADAPAVAGYCGGAWPTFSSLAARFPNAQRLSIAVTSAHDADALDVEPGDATVADAPNWVVRQHTRGLTRPCLYASASVMSDLLATLNRAGIPRTSVRLWSAHYTGSAHICAPTGCGQVPTPMDATQWTSSAFNRNLDQSLIADDFFTGSAAAPSWQEAVMNALPTLQQGARDVTGQPLTVHRVQVLVAGIGAWNQLGAVTQVTADGAFGPSTAAGVKKVQQFFGLTQDSTVGPATWKALVTGAA